MSQPAPLTKKTPTTTPSTLVPPSTPLGPKLHTRKDVAKRLSVCVMTIKRLEFSGQLPALKFNSRCTRYEEAAVQKLIDNARVGAGVNL